MRGKQQEMREDSDSEHTEDQGLEPHQQSQNQGALLKLLLSPASLCVLVRCHADLFFVCQAPMCYHGTAAVGRSSRKNCLSICVEAVCSRTASLEVSHSTRRMSSCDTATFSQHGGHQDKVMTQSHRLFVRDTTK